jgi:hypothetical protein
MTPSEERFWLAVGRVLWASLVLIAAFVGGLVGSCVVRTP